MSAAGAIGASLVPGVASVIAGQQTNATNKKIANAQMAFEAEQSNTVYQRGAADLKAAGLNPMLAIAHPDPVAQYTPPQYESPLGKAASAAITNFSALQGARQAEAGIEQARTQSNLNNALALKASADTNSSNAAAMLTAANTDKVKSGSILSNAIGSDAASKTSQFLNSAADNIHTKLNNLISGITGNSSKSLSREDISNIFSFDKFSDGSNARPDPRKLSNYQPVMPPMN